MADFIGVMDSAHPGVPIKYVDMGDGTFAQVFADDIQSGTQITASSGNVANASAVATLAGVTLKTTNIVGFQITGAGATGASLVLVTVTGIVGGTATYVVAVPAGVTLGITPLIVQFFEPIPATAVNTAIVVTLPALGAGNTNAAVSAQGFQL